MRATEWSTVYLRRLGHDVCAQGHLDAAGRFATDGHVEEDYWGSHDCFCTEVESIQKGVVKCTLGCGAVQRGDSDAVGVGDCVCGDDADGIVSVMICHGGGGGGGGGDGWVVGGVAR